MSCFLECAIIGRRFHILGQFAFLLDIRVKNYIFSPSPLSTTHNRRTIDMAKIHRCPTCKVVSVNDHYKQTSHIPLPYNCELESCERTYKEVIPSTKGTVGVLNRFIYPMKHILSKHPHSPFPYNCKPCKRVLDFKTIPSLLNVRIQFSVSKLTA